MYDTVVTVTGNVGSDVRQVVTPQGATLASFRLANTPRRQDRATGAWIDGATTWYRVTTWRSLADNVSSSLTKGDPVLVHGRLRSTPWEKDGRSGESLEIDAITVGPDLSRGRTVFHRVGRAAAAAGGSPDERRDPTDPNSAGHTNSAGHLNSAGDTDAAGDADGGSSADLDADRARLAAQAVAVGS